MFVTSSNFDTPPYSLPNLDNVVNTFPDFVEASEESALLGLLGRQLYDAFIAGLDALPDDYDEETATVIGDEYVYGNDIWEALTETTGVFPVEGVAWTLVEADNKWLKLKNGAEYEHESKTYQWRGMTWLLIPYIYSQWLEANADSFTGSGVVTDANENSQVGSPLVRICNSYNDFARRSGVTENPGYYTMVDSLYGFLYVEEDNYEDWLWESPETINPFDL